MKCPRTRQPPDEHQVTPQVLHTILSRKKTIPLK
jgi:hypothetical protein